MIYHEWIQNQIDLIIIFKLNKKLLPLICKFYWFVIVKIAALSDFWPILR